MAPIIKPKGMKKMMDEEMPMPTGPKDLATAYGMKRRSMKAPKKMAEGGFVQDEKHIMTSTPPKSHLGMSTSKGSSIADKILAGRKMMAEGGRVDIESNNEEQPNMMDELNIDALGKENYDLEPEDAQDMISAIRSKMAAKRMFR